MSLKQILPVLLFRRLLRERNPGRMDTRLTEAERKKRWREAVIIVLAVILIVFLTRAEISLTQLSADAKLGSNISIFVVINIVILLVILLVYLVSRNVVKLFLCLLYTSPSPRDGLLSRMPS